MSIVKFLTSKTFFKHLAIALASLVVLVFVLLKFLEIKTNHGEEIPVPDLSKMQVQIGKEKIEELGLELILLDTVDFRSDMPPYSIVEQDPKAESTVKNGRKIYVKVNAGEYDEVTLPALKGKTYRQVSANIKSLGLKEGKITYKPHMAKDEVLAVTQGGKTLKGGDKIKKNSTLDFVLGDGKEFYNEETFDKEQVLETETLTEDAGTE
jgi:beta-lactam-binding protein with PASTA domain